MFVLGAFYAGDVAGGERVLRPLRDIGDPVADVIDPQQYTAWQQTFDPLAAEGMRNYWKSHNFVEITDGMTDTFAEYGETIRRRSPKSPARNSAVPSTTCPSRRPRTLTATPGS